MRFRGSRVHGHRALVRLTPRNSAPAIIIKHVCICIYIYVIIYIYVYRYDSHVYIYIYM